MSIVEINSSNSGIYASNMGSCGIVYDLNADYNQQRGMPWHLTDDA